MKDRIDQWLPLPDAGMNIRVGGRYDVWARRWNAHDNTFTGMRFVDVELGPTRVPGAPTGNASNWGGMPDGWFVTHVMDIPERPE